MLERWETRGERSYATRYVLKETSHHPAVFSRPSRPGAPESPLVDAVYRSVGVIMLAATGLILWVMATAT
jgi:hypothetical protein